MAEATAVQPHVVGQTAGAWGFPRVAGRCPSCGSASLFLGSGGYVTCAVLACSDPCAASDLLMPASGGSSTDGGTDA